MTDQKTIKARISRVDKDEFVEMEVELDLIKEKVKLWCSSKIVGWQDVRYNWEDRGYCCPYEDEDYFIWAIFQSIDGEVFVICYLTPGIILFEDNFVTSFIQAYKIELDFFRYLLICKRPHQLF